MFFLKKQDRFRYWKMFLLACMYLCQAIPLGYVFGSLPVIMREGRMSLASVGGLFMLHLPWALKFLYASWVDRSRISRLGRRKSWIFPLQWIGAVLLLLAAGLPPETNFRSMYLVLMLLNIVMATNDIAVDGYATDILESEERTWGNTLQAGARFVGMMLGGGVMLFLHSTMGWDFLCKVLAATVLLLSLPVVFHKEIESIHVDARQGDKAVEGALAFIRKPGISYLLVVLIAPTAFVLSGFMMRTPLLVDLGYSSRTIGGLLMHYGYPLGLAGTIFSGWLLSRIGPRCFLRLFCGVAILLALHTVYCSRSESMPLWQAAVVLSLDNILIGGINVWGFCLMMRASFGRNSGTGFAVLSSLFILVPIAIAPLTGRAGDLLGFDVLYTLLSGLVLFGLIAAEGAFRRRKQDPVLFSGSVSSEASKDIA